MERLNTIRFSDSQKDIMRLETVCPGAVNLITCSVLYSAAGQPKFLEAVIEQIYSKWAILSAKWNGDSAGLSIGEKRTDIPAAVTFSCKQEFEAWAQNQGEQTFASGDYLVLILPVVLEAERMEGFFVKAHHLICDGRSIMLLISAIDSVYSALLKGEPVHIETGNPYEQFAADEQAFLSGKRAERARAYWESVFIKSRAVSLIAESNSHDYRAERFTSVLNAPEREALAAYARSQNVTLQTLLTTAVCAVCHRLHGGENSFVGILLLNRTTPGEMNAIGNYFNTAALPVEIHAETRFRDLLKSISGELMVLLRHQRFGYSHIMEQYQLCGGNNSKLFDVLVSCQDQTAFSNSEARVCWYPPKAQVEALQITVVDNGEKLEIHYDYRPSCLAPSRVKAFSRRVISMLHEGMRDGDAFVDQIPQVLPEDLACMRKWNDTAFSYPAGETLCSLFEAKANEIPNQTALRYGNERWSYRLLNERANRLAHHLQALGVLPGSIVALMTERSFDLLLGVYAIQKCGAAYMPIGIDYPAERVRFMLEDSEARVLLTQSKWKLETPGHVIRVDIDRLDTTAYSCENPGLARPEYAAYVIYTSGSTGKPKGALISHRSAINRIHWMNRVFGMLADDVILQKTPYTFDVSVWELFWWGMYGGTLAILPPEEHKDPSKILRAVERYAVTKMHFVPSMLAAFLEFVSRTPYEAALQSLKQVFASGEALLPAQVDRFYRLLPNAELINLYGPTECTVDVSCFRCPKQSLPAIPIGAPIDNTQLYIVDKQNALVPIGEAGELCVAGDLVGMGYLKRPELTVERFLSNPFGKGKLYKTGDLASWNEDGTVAYLGRIDFQVKLHGQRIELGEIERCLVAIEEITQAVVTVQKSCGVADQLVAYYSAPEAIDSKSISQILSEKLPEYMIPQGYLYLQALPLTASGKVDRKQLPAVDLSQNTSQEAYIKPESETQIAICEAFARALNLSPRQIGLKDNFFLLGGNSLRAINLMTDLHGLYGFTIREIYENPTPEALETLFWDRRQGTAQPESYAEDEIYRMLCLPDRKAEWHGAGGVLLTGATGFLGGHLLHELLERTEAEVYCLVRNPQKLRDHWSYLFDGEPYPNARIHIVRGDLTQEHLGLSAGDYTRLTKSVSAVFHAAADVRHFGVWEQSYKTNTVGTRHIIDLCFDANAEMHHISTMSVNGYVLTPMQALNEEPFTENRLFIGQQYKENVYVHSKYLAETAILDAMQYGLQASIYRVGNLLWRRRDLKFQRNREAHDFFMLTRAFVQLDMLPEKFCELRVNMTAVDSCAEAILTLARAHISRVYHMLNRHDLSLYEYLCRVSQKRLRIVSMNEFVHALEQHASDPVMGFLLAYTAINENASADTYPTESCAQTVEALARLGFEWEEPTDSYIRYCQETKQEGE